MPPSTRLLFYFACAWFFIPWVGVAEEVDFETEVRPILNRHCAQCHGEDQREGGLRFTNRHEALLELDSGSYAIVAGAPEKSSLLSRITSTDDSERMPPDGQSLSTRSQVWPRCGGGLPKLIALATHPVQTLY